MFCPLIYMSQKLLINPSKLNVSIIMIENYHMTVKVHWALPHCGAGNGGNAT